ncbi:methyltransferase domain-containing protein [Oceanisphaera avium]|uniref:tRNA 5-carboxymethoxyuridine methyltransferase n=1 Tax=Oceanisphaera avium TaxID=1903694 RepID=A0A1Y0CVA2_9GAMM|nr:methyltransferase domain-containing protein [Oceanisphaera avium]ART79169.1 tRNA uridine 5-oxyacetic acid(34) methyltransferase CmoM [Oceanisphaera avium]
MHTTSKLNTNFDGRAAVFARNIYGTTKGRIRLAVVERDLKALLASLPAHKKLRILDAGGGFGPLSQDLAALGHEVVLCDLSADMLELAHQQVSDKGLLKQFSFIHGPIQDLKVAELGQFDIILCHAVLEWVEQQAQLLACLAALLVENGHLSLMFYNRDGLMYHSLVMGHFDYVYADLVKKRRQKLTPNWPCRPQQVNDWLGALGLVITDCSGVRVFHDYMVAKHIRLEQADEVIAMELAHAKQAPFMHLGRYLHLVAKKTVPGSPLKEKESNT